MANVYEEKTETLHELLNRARSEDGATVLIPDLQRPYVWTPNQVTLLIDSLIRGWPVGTLLMWRVSQGELPSIPHRQFWTVVDRTSGNGSTAVARKDPPAQYHMVLDGQQRVQSLLLALGGDGWSFKLEDRDWAQELQDRRPRGRLGKYRHWSKASLCFDAGAFLSAYSECKSLLSVDFRSVLKWVITDPVDGQSKWKKPATYDEPLDRSFDEKNRGRFIRLSRLWTAATANPNLKEAQFREIVRGVFATEGVPEEKIEALLEPMGELMTTLRDVKMSKVAFLELLPYDKHVWTEDAYNDAIVNIFTRLNTAGRTLTREEITLAWLKVGWDSEATGGRTAAECFQELLNEVAERGLVIEMDSLVGAVSFAWAVCCNRGQLLANRDLLRGATIRPMASELARRWSGIRRAVVEGLDAVRQRGLEYGQAGHYSSLNALAFLWTWLYIAIEWEERHQLPVTQRDDFQKKLARTLESAVDRWLICSQWAGRWGGASAPVVAGYAKALHDDFSACAGAVDPDEVHGALSARLSAAVKELESDAANYVNNLLATSRERVSIYRTALWIWHRLDEPRWNMSRISLRVGRGRPALEVDHVVAARLWELRLETGLPTGAQEHEDALELANLVGNCSLLEKSFNISKSAKSLRSFIDQVHEVKEKEIDLADWAQALGLADCLLEPGTATTDAIAAAIRARDTWMRAELVEFVKGQKSRVDL